jgi:HEAT repeat protein
MDTPQSEQIIELFNNKDIAGLAKALHDDDNNVRRLAAGALIKLGPEAEGAVTDLIEALNDWDPVVRAAAASALGAIGPAAASALPALTRTTMDTEFIVSMWATSALKDIRPGANKKDPSPDVEALFGYKSRRRGQDADMGILDTLNQEVEPRPISAKDFLIDLLLGF